MRASAHACMFCMQVRLQGYSGEDRELAFHKNKSVSYFGTHVKINIDMCNKDIGACLLVK